MLHSLALVALLVADVSGETCGDIKESYRGSECCGASADKPLDIVYADIASALPFLQAGLSEPNADVQYFENAIAGPKLAAEFGGNAGFYHSVASGSPTPDSVIIWTRYTPVSADAKVDVTFFMAEGTDEAALTNAPLSGSMLVEPGHDWIAKLDIKGLKPGTSYVFGFSAEGNASPVGHTKTAPAEGWVGEMTYVVFACSQWENGFFHAYDVASTVKNLDFWVHTGDYLYEYGRGFSEQRQDYLDPQWEIVRIGDYRRRHAKYVEDVGLSNLRATAPLISMWDDHEFTNNPYGNGMGADNHQPVCNGNRTDPGDACTEDEGDFLIRANVAAQAYFEWLPVRRGPKALSGKIDTDMTQIIEWGSLATIMMQDSRITARPAHGTLGLFAPDYSGSMLGVFGAAASTAGIDPRTYTADDFAEAQATVEAEINKEEYELLGAEQRELLAATMAASKAKNKPWQIYGASVVVPDQVGPGNMYNLNNTNPDYPGLIGILDATYGGPLGGTLLALAGLELFQQGWNEDSWTGFKAERAKLYDILAANTNNAIILSGDVHDFWAYEMRKADGTPVGVNIVAGGVTANGWGSFAGPALAGFGQDRYNLFEEAWKLADPKLKYAGVKDKGFWVCKANATHHVSEQISINTNDLAANPTNGEISFIDPATYAPAKAPSYCDGSLTTLANAPGTLTPNANCEIEFEDAAAVSRRRAAVTPLSAKRAHTCDCLFAEKVGVECTCAATEA